MSADTRWHVPIFQHIGLLTEDEAQDMARRLNERDIPATVVRWEDGYLCTVLRDQLEEAELTLKGSNF